MTFPGYRNSCYQSWSLQGDCHHRQCYTHSANSEKSPFFILKMKNIERHHDEGVARQTAFNFHRNEDSNEYQTLGLSITNFCLSECLGIMNTRKVPRAYYITIFFVTLTITNFSLTYPLKHHQGPNAFTIV